MVQFVCDSVVLSSNSVRMELYGSRYESLMTRPFELVFRALSAEDTATLRTGSSRSVTCFPNPDAFPPRPSHDLQSWCLNAPGAEEGKPKRRPRDEEGRPQRPAPFGESALGDGRREAAGVEEQDQGQRNPRRSHRGKRKRRSSLRNPLKDRNQKSVGGVQRVGERGCDVACERTEEP